MPSLRQRKRPKPDVEEGEVFHPATGPKCRNQMDHEKPDGCGKIVKGEEFLRK